MELVEEADEFVRREGEAVEHVPPLELQLRDPDDVAIIAKSVAGQADFLVTGDKDLLEVAHHTRPF